MEGAQHLLIAPIPAATGSFPSPLPSGFHFDLKVRLLSEEAEVITIPIS